MKPPPANQRSPSAKKTMNKKPAKIKKNLTERQKFIRRYDFTDKCG